MLDSQALPTAEHFLLGRYFDYQQISFHKTVAALELVLKDIVAELLKIEELDCSTAGIEDMILTGQWFQFDDPDVLRMIRDLKQDSGSGDTVLQTKIDSLLQRSPPKLIGSIEFMEDRNERSRHAGYVKDLDRIAGELSNEFDIPRGLWFVWENRVGPSPMLVHMYQFRCSHSPKTSLNRLYG